MDIYYGMDHFFYELFRRREKIERFRWNDPNSDYSIELILNAKGVPIYARYGIVSSLSQDDSIIDKYIFQTVMEKFFENDINAFRKIRDLLNPNYFDAEDKLRRKKTMERKIAEIREEYDY